MKVLVTGGCGFLGSHICERYIEKGWEVIAYDNLTKYELNRTGFDVEKARDYNVNFLKNLGVAVVVKDVRDFDTLKWYAADSNYIIHTAAQPAMTIAIEDPQMDFEVNVQGTLNVLRAADRVGIPVVNCSTIHIYGTGINKHLMEYRDGFHIRGTMSQGIDEKRKILTGEITPLHASKRCAEIYMRTFQETFGTKTATFRLTGMYGPRQFGGEDHGWVVNFAIRTIIGKPIKIFGTDLQVRDILYVTDAVSAFEKWYENGRPSGEYNIGGGVKTYTSLRQCLEILNQLTGERQDISILPSRKGDLHYFCCNTLLAESQFGWRATVSPVEGIRKLINWIKEEKEIFQGE